MNGAIGVVVRNLAALESNLELESAIIRCKNVPNSKKLVILILKKSLGLCMEAAIASVCRKNGESATYKHVPNRLRT